MNRRDVLATLGFLTLEGAIPVALSFEKPDTAPGGSTRSLLRIDCSARTDESHSRKLADVIERGWRAQHPQGIVNARDFAEEPVQHINLESVTGFYTDPSQYTQQIKEAMAYSDMLVKELIDADDFLFSIPMYNFTIPSSFKAQLDQVVRPGYAFTMAPDGTVKGLLNGKRAYVSLAYGFEYTGTDLQAYDFVKPYLQAIFGYVGLHDVHYVAVEGTALGMPEKLAKSTARAHREANRSFGK